MLLDTNQDLDTCQAELGVTVKQLKTPLTRRATQREGEEFAIDNGAFGGFDAQLFYRRHIEPPLFRTEELSEAVAQ